MPLFSSHVSFDSNGVNGKQRSGFIEAAKTSTVENEKKDKKKTKRTSRSEKMRDLKAEMEMVRNGKNLQST